MPADADGRVRRTDTAACRFLHRPFDNAILKRVKRDNREPPARTQCVYRIAERVRQDRQLLIDLDANRLKDPLRGMPALCAYRLRHGTVDDGDELDLVATAFRPVARSVRRTALAVLSAAAHVGGASTVALRHRTL